MTLQDAVEWCCNHGAEVDFGIEVTFLKTDVLWLDGPDLPSLVEKAIGIEQEEALQDLEASIEAGRQMVNDEVGFQYYKF